MDKIKQIVMKLVKRHKTNDPYQLAARYKNIHILPVSLDLSVKGFYMYQNRNKIIFVNNRLDLATQRATCAHELGHAFLHPRGNFFELKRTPRVLREMERQADIFATEFLLPDRIFFSYAGYTTEQIAALEQIPYELAALKRSLLGKSL